MRVEGNGSYLVAFDATALQPHKSGIGTYTENLIGALLETNAIAEILLLSNKTPVLPSVNGNGEKIRDHADGKFPVRAVWMQAILPRLLARLRPALCHFPNYLAPLSSPCPRVVTIHDMSLCRYPEMFTWKKRYPSRALLPEVARRAEAVITVSEFSRREILAVLGLPEEKIHLIREAPSPLFHPVTDAVRLAEVRRRHGVPERFVLSVGTREPRKNLLRLLDAFDDLVTKSARLRDVRLVLVGASGWRNEAIRLRVARGVASGRIVDLGYVPEEDLPALYSMAAALAYPSLYEGFGLPILEGMASGVPVLTSNRTATAEVGGPAALLVDPEDTRAIRDGLETLLTNGDLARELSEKGLAHAARFSWEAAAGETIEVYRKVVRAWNGARGPSGARGSNGSEGPVGLPAVPVQKPNPASLRRAVLRTVLYADLFDSPIGTAELHRFLIGCETDLPAIESALRDDAVLRSKLSCVGDQIVLRGREPLAEKREREREATKRMLAQNDRVLRLLSGIPFVRMAAFSGGTSHENSPSSNDVDLFLITAAGRTWTAYTLLVVLSRLFRRRREICMNYLVDSKHLALPKKGDLFTAHELLHLKPLLGARWGEALVDANRWAYDLFPNAGPLSIDHLGKESRRLQRFGEFLLAPFAFLLERAASRVFRRRLERHTEASARPDVLLSDGILKLHIDDRRGPIVERFRRRLREAGVSDASIESRLGPSIEPDARAAAWDLAAPSYDAIEAANGLLADLRARFHERMEAWIEPGARVLDLGCGTGIDTLRLAGRGSRVTAIDVSPAMIRVLRGKAAAVSRSGAPAPETRVLSLDDLGRLLPDREGAFDAAIADFGSLNCVADLPRLSERLGRLVRPGGHVVVAVLNRVSVWEIVYHLLRLRPRDAFRRLGRGARKAKVGAGTVDVFYPSPKKFARAFASSFDVVETRPHALLLPPPYLDRLSRRAPRLLRMLRKAEDRVAGWSGGAALADHFLMVLRRKGESAPEPRPIEHAPRARAAEEGPVDLLLVHPYALLLDDARFYELLPYPPLGLLMIAAVARAMGYRVAIWDGTFSDRLRGLRESAERLRPRLIGVGSWSSYRGNARAVFEELRPLGVPLLAGGPDPSIYPNDYLDAGADLVVIGEGEATLRELLPVLLGAPNGSGRGGSPGSNDRPASWDPESLSRIPGLLLRESRSAGGRITRTASRARIDDLEDLPLPAYDLVPTDLYLDAWERKFGFTSLPLMTARGCPFQCTWCARPSFGRVYKQRSVDHVMRELRYLVEVLGARYVRVVDDTFVIRKTWIEEWSRKIRESGLVFEYECLARVELLTDPVVRALRESGCVKVFCGVESGSQKVLDAMKKGTTVEGIFDAGRRLREAGIRFHAYLMFGYPSERHRDVRSTMKLLRRLRPDEHSISIAYPMPGTEFYDLVHLAMQARGWRNRDDEELQFEGEYSPFYYRVARAVARRRYAPGHPADLAERVYGWALEGLFFATRLRDELFHRRTPSSAPVSVGAPAAVEAPGAVDRKS
jgi:radical SAM superfamily enzyme YgiQ (UPF0313 family)/glycosyltransferase involved in cell wall biosynthesis/SAM-dependent methyltransferase